MGEVMLYLRDYQVKATDAVIDSLKNPESCPIISMATGTGKSIVIASIIQRLLNPYPKLRIVMATHVSELIVQNHKKLKHLIPDADTGIYSAGLGLKSLNSQITFAGIQSIHKADFNTPINLLLVDECHLISKKDSSMWKSFIEKLRSKNDKLRIVGLSATAFRLDSGSLIDGEGSLFNNICFDYGLGRAINDGWLCSLTAKQTHTKIDFSKVRIENGEYKTSDVDDAFNIDEITNKIVNEVISKAGDRKSWLFFCSSVKHSLAVRDCLRSKGIITETVSGDTPAPERDGILKGFQDGKIKAVTNFGVWTTGVDIPNVDMIVMMRKTASGGLLLQMAGRGTRSTINLGTYSTSKERKEAIAKSDKSNCLFLDYGGNIEEHGMLDQIKAKDKKEKGDKPPPLKFCPECEELLYASARECKVCGHKFSTGIEGATLLKTGYDGAVVSGETWFEDVENVTYHIHNQEKDGKIPCLKVNYKLLNGTCMSEYVCLQHKGKARQNALQWWKIHNGAFPAPENIEYMLNMGVAQNLLIPSRIEIAMDGKYKRVINYDFSLRIDEDKTSPAMSCNFDDETDFTL